VFYCVAYSLFFFSITFDGVCSSLIKLIVIIIVIIARDRPTRFNANLSEEMHEIY